MAYHAGDRHSVVNPGTKLWRPPFEVTQFCPPRIDFGARFLFCKTKQNKFISMKPNSYSNHFQPLLFHAIPRLLINIIFLVLQKTGAKT